MDPILLVIIILWSVIPFIVSVYAKRKGYNQASFFIGSFFFPPAGIVACIVVEDKVKKERQEIQDMLFSNHLAQQKQIIELLTNLKSS